MNSTSKKHITEQVCALQLPATLEMVNLYIVFFIFKKKKSNLFL